MVGTLYTQFTIDKHSNVCWNDVTVVNLPLVCTTAHVSLKERLLSVYISKFAFGVWVCVQWERRSNWAGIPAHACLCRSDWDSWPQLSRSSCLSPSCLSLCTYKMKTGICHTVFSHNDHFQFFLLHDSLEYLWSNISFNEKYIFRWHY